jgi:hypothetical protein
MRMILLYYQDQNLVSKSCLDSLNEWSKKWLMNINLKKNKVMILQKHNSKPQTLDFFLGDKRIDITNEYTYLGLKLTPNTNWKIINIENIEKFVQDRNINDFVKTIKDNYTSFWKHQIKNSSKLSFYSTF